jgi:hypothetical protein
MTYTHRLSRWMHKRLAHNYTQAGLLHPYTIRLSTILRDSGTHTSARGHENSRRVDEAFEELRERHILLLWHIQDYVTQHVIGAHTTGLRSPNHVP